MPSCGVRLEQRLPRSASVVAGMEHKRPPGKSFASDRGTELKTHRSHPEEAHRSRVYPRSAHQVRKSARADLRCAVSKDGRWLGLACGRPSRRAHRSQACADCVNLSARARSSGRGSLMHRYDSNLGNAVPDAPHLRLSEQGILCSECDGHHKGSCAAVQTIAT